MTIQELIKEYKDQVELLFNTNYSDKQSVQLHNNKSKRLIEIVNIISTNFGSSGTEEFAGLLNYENYDTKLYAAIHLLEKLNPSQEIKEKSLNIIEKYAKKDDIRGIGLKHWLKNRQ